MLHKTKQLFLITLFLTTLSHTTASTKIHDAAIFGNCDEIRRLIKEGANPNDRNHFSGTPLYVAASMNHIDATETLIALGAHKNSRNFRHQTALHIAALKGHTGVVSTLIKLGANPNAKQIWGLTPFHFAALRGHKDIIRIFLECGANKAALDMNSKTVADIAEEKILHDLQYIHPMSARAFIRWYTPERAQLCYSLPGKAVTYAYQQYVQGNPQLLATILSGYFVPTPQTNTFSTGLVQEFRQLLAAITSSHKASTPQIAKPHRFLPDNPIRNAHSLFEPETLSSIIDDLQTKYPNLNFNHDLSAQASHEQPETKKLRLERIQKLYEHIKDS